MTIKKQSTSSKIFYFWIGIIAALAYRVIIVLNFYEPVWVNVAWYIGTIGFIAYFWNRYKVVKQFTHLIKEQKLIAAVKKAGNISKDERAALLHIVDTLKHTKAHINYELIFLFSVIALGAGIYLDFFN